MSSVDPTDDPVHRPEDFDLAERSRSRAHLAALAVFSQRAGGLREHAWHCADATTSARAAHASALDVRRRNAWNGTMMNTAIARYPSTASTGRNSPTTIITR